jgi:hypothetical protein
MTDNQGTVAYLSIALLISVQLQFVDALAATSKKKKAPNPGFQNCEYIKNNYCYKDRIKDVYWKCKGLGYLYVNPARDTGQLKFRFDYLHKQGKCKPLS